jgi:hypothetical protein
VAVVPGPASTRADTRLCPRPTRASSLGGSPRSPTTSHGGRPDARRAHRPATDPNPCGAGPWTRRELTTEENSAARHLGRRLQHARTQRREQASNRRETFRGSILDPPHGAQQGPSPAETAVRGLLVGPTESHSILLNLTGRVGYVLADGRAVAPPQRRHPGSHRA